MEDGEPRYEIEARQAYDAISRKSLPPSRELERVQMLYHGSLGIREERSRETLDYLRRTLRVPTLLDVNLRDPWWIRDVLVSRTQGVNCVKMNREEAEILAGRPARGEAELLATARSLHSALEIGTLVVTLGADGALAVHSDEVHRQEAPSLSELVDPVGAGDAFSAVLALGMHERWAVETTLRRATEFAAELCRVRGAIPQDPDLYARHLRRWNHAA